MTRRNYQPLQMHRMTWTDLSEDQVLQALELSENGGKAVKSGYGVPLHDNSTAAQMARLQGQLAERRWESGRLEAGYVNTDAGWKIAKLEYRG